MYYICLVIFIIAAYLLGSINPAIIITRLKKGVDIRTLGTGNPGTANVSRNLGKSRGALVLLPDILKGLIPVIVARHLCFPADNIQNYAATVLIGMAAITGHCKPLWYNFSGGGGIATSIGILLYLIPAEFFISMLLGFVSSRIFFRKKKYSVSQITPMIFIPLTPFVTLASFLTGAANLFRNLTLFVREWHEGVFLPVPLRFFSFRSIFISGTGSLSFYWGTLPFFPSASTSLG